MRKAVATGLSLSLAVIGSLALVGARTGRAAVCPPGYHPLAREEAGRDQSLWLHAHPAAARAVNQRLAGLCVNDLHPELYDEILAGSAQQQAMIGSAAPGAYAAAVRQARALRASSASVPNAGGTWTAYGKGPLLAADPRYDSVNGEGLDRLSGRVDSLEYDQKHHRLFATIGTGGVWMSKDLGKHWRSVGNHLLTQINGAVGWSNARGGTLVVVSGEPLNGGDTYVGMGAFWTTDLGKHWHKAKGVPNGAMGYQVAVNPKNNRVIYVATSQGLYRSADAGRHFANVKLPTGPCKGKVGYGRCEFANFVTDVVIKAPGGKTKAKGGSVLAAVGYRAGQNQFPNGKEQSPMNGLYRSATGKRGTFKKLAATGFAEQERIGRTELGLATGPKQNHNFVYAEVEDARLFNEGQSAQIDVPDQAIGTGVGNTVFNGIYVSKDFGKTWTQLADTSEISDNPNTQSALVGAGQATLYAPGVQSWYNEWIKVDPTRQTADGVPTRILFGLEEIWANRNTTEAQDGSNNTDDDFHVIGPYFAGDSCMLLDTGQPFCPTRAETDRTTHPDQHDATFVPDGKGGVTVIVGNDGGVFQQHQAKGGEFTADKWGAGTNDGFHTLLPYDADMANDGRTWIGLQDNGSGYIDGTTQKQYMTFGGDGFYVAVDPGKSNIGYSEVTFANMRVTTDGGQNWRDMGPIDAATGNQNSYQFANPFVMDPKDPNHLMTAGSQVLESTYGPDTQQMDPQDNVCMQNCWQSVFDSGGMTVSNLSLYRDAAYVGFCDACDLINNWDTGGFHEKLATNVGGSAPPKRMTSDGWHFAKAQGLPNRFITGVAIDPKNPKTVYVTLGGYNNRQWVPPGSYLDPNKHIGVGHVYKSTDAGDHFTNVSANLPNAPAFTVQIHGNQLVVGTQVGAFVSKNTNGGKWARLGHGLPNTPINQLSWKGGNPSTNVLVAATFGRGVYLYHFPK